MLTAASKNTTGPSPTLTRPSGSILRVAVVFTSRGLAYAGKQEYGRAVADFTEAVKLDPRMAAAFYYRGNAYADKKEYDSAIADYTAVLRIDAKDALAFNNRGTAYANKKQYVSAYKDYARAVELDPQYGHALNNLAWMLATCPRDDLRDGKKAIEHATKACELSDWKVASRLSTLAAAHAECGSFTEAVEWENKAIGMGLATKHEMELAYQRLHLYEKGKPYRE